VSRRSDRRPIVRYEHGVATTRIDTVAVEDPLTVSVDGEEVFTTMRTPGDDIDLALGWLVSDGVVSHADDVVSARECRTFAEPSLADPGLDSMTERTAVEVELRTLRRPSPRHGWTSSACGICGTEAIDEVVDRLLAPLTVTPDIAKASMLSSLPDTLRQSQAVFDRTGGLHAAGLFTLSGQLLVLREDVGRHNAVDKVIGWALAEQRLPLTEHVLQLSGRASFELVQKASMAGVGVVAAVSAPSSLAVELADRAGVTLIGFLRDDTMNVYTHPVRVH